MKEKISKHPFKPFIPENATKLIIGTIPPYRFCVDSEKLKEDDVNFYYGSKDNEFWSLVYKSVYGSTEGLITKNTAEAIEQRKKTLEELGMGITDVIESCYHLDGNSDDSSLKTIKQKDIRALLRNNERIDTLIYTSYFVKTQMNTICDKSYHSLADKEERKWKATINGKEYTVFLLYSPSPNALRGVDEETRSKQYCSIFHK